MAKLTYNLNHNNKVTKSDYNRLALVILEKIKLTGASLNADELALKNTITSQGVTLASSEMSDSVANQLT